MILICEKDKRVCCYALLPILIGLLVENKCKRMHNKHLFKYNRTSVRRDAYFLDALIKDFTLLLYSVQT